MYGLNAEESVVAPGRALCTKGAVPIEAPSQGVEALLEQQAVGGTLIELTGTGFVANSTFCRFGDELIEGPPEAIALLKKRSAGSCALAT